MRVAPSLGAKSGAKKRGVESVEGAAEKSYPLSGEPPTSEPRRAEQRLRNTLFSLLGAEICSMLIMQEDE